MSFEDDLAAAKASDRPSLIVRLEVGGKKHRFKFTQMRGTEYAAETLKHLPDLTVALHRQYGYDINSLSRAVAPRCAVLLEGKSERALTADQWADLFDVMEGGAHEAVANAVFELNEFANARKVSSAKKVLAETADASS